MLPQDRQVRLAYDHGMTASRNTQIKRIGLILASIITLILLWNTFPTTSPRVPSPAAWQTRSTDWDLPLPEQAIVAGIAADRVRYLQAGNDLHIGFRTLVIEKHPEIPELRIATIALRIEPGRYSAGEPQTLEGVLTAARLVLLRTTATFTVKDGVACLQEGHCSYWLELTLREPDGRITVERSAKLSIPRRPVVMDQKK